MDPLFSSQLSSALSIAECSLFCTTTKYWDPTLALRRQHNSSCYSCSFWRTKRGKGIQKGAFLVLSTYTQGPTKGCNNMKDPGVVIQKIIKCLQQKVPQSRDMWFRKLRREWESAVHVWCFYPSHHTSIKVPVPSLFLRLHCDGDLWCKSGGFGRYFHKAALEGRKNESEIFNFKHLECLIKKTTIKQTEPIAIYSFLFK